MSREVVTFSIQPATQGMLPEILSIEEASFTAPWTGKMFEAELTRNPFSWCRVAMMAVIDTCPMMLKALSTVRNDGLAIEKNTMSASKVKTGAILRN